MRKVVVNKIEIANGDAVLGLDVHAADQTRYWKIGSYKHDPW